MTNSNFFFLSTAIKFQEKCVFMHTDNYIIPEKEEEEGLSENKDLAAKECI